MSAPDPRPTITVLDLGRVEYDVAWAAQKRLQAARVAAKRKGESLPGVLLLVEHPPVYTLGQNANAGNLLCTEAEFAALGATVRKIDRGGDVTFHGPGQLVGYPILDLERVARPDLHDYLRRLEAVMIGVCADYGLDARRVPGRTGVWIGAEGAERKVCAFGIRCARWVTMHGWALNVDTDLGWFAHLVPCGIEDRGVTSLAAELGRPVDEAEARVLHHFAHAFEVALDVREGDDAHRLAGLDAPG